MAEKKKPTLGATVAPPNEKADFFAQLQNTFERGVVSAEVDLSGLISEKGGGSVTTSMFGEAARVTTGPAGVSDQTIQKMKTIANTFGGKFTVHAPMQANPSDIMEVGRTQAAQLLKKSLEYTEKLGGKVLTVHPMGQMEYYFVDPFVGTKMNVPNPFFLAANRKELHQMMRKFGVKDPLLKEQIEKQWSNWVQVLPTYFAEKFAPMAARSLEDFSENVASWKIGELINRYRNNPQKIREKAIEIMGTLAAPVAGAFERKLREVLINGTLTPTAKQYASRTAIDYHRRRAEEMWTKVAMASLDPIAKDGSVPRPPEELRRLASKKHLTKDERQRYRTLREKYRKEIEAVRAEAWGKTITRQRFGPFKESEEEIKNAVIKTFRQIFESIKKENKGLYRSLKNRKIKIGIENLFPMAPEKGYMQGFAYFYRPEHIAEIVKAIRKEAKDQGLPEDIVTVTFDVAHAAASGIKPSEFLKKLRKSGVKPEHVHIVGGPGYGHEHIAWGDWLDEVSRMDPGIVKKLMDVGVINIEGGAGLHDVEVTLNALWDRGLPVEAMMAMAGAPDRFTPELVQYSGFPKGAYADVAPAYFGTIMPQRAFYSFQYEAVPMPMRGAFGGYTAPALFGGGYTIGPQRTPSLWPSAQPFLYSAKKEE